MSVAARLKLGAALFFGLSFGTAVAQEGGTPSGAWTDPPARAAAATPAARTPDEVKPAEAKTMGAKTVEAKTVETKTAPSREAREPKPKALARTAERRMPHAQRHTGRSLRPRLEARTKPAHRTLTVSALHPTRDRAASPPTMRHVYDDPERAEEYGLPVGQVGRPAPFGARSMDERIRAAQAAGYLVVRARSVQFPDGRSLRVYQPFGGEGDED